MLLTTAAATNWGQKQAAQLSLPSTACDGAAEQGATSNSSSVVPLPHDIMTLTSVCAISCDIGNVPESGRVRIE